MRLVFFRFCKAVAGRGGLYNVLPIFFVIADYGGNKLNVRTFVLILKWSDWLSGVINSSVDSVMNIVLECDVTIPVV